MPDPAHDLASDTRPESGEPNPSPLLSQISPNQISPSQIAFASVVELASWLRRGELSPRELTQLYLDRIAQLDPHLGSYFHVAAEGAIAEAEVKTKTLSQRRRQGESLDSLPLLYGIPISIKDMRDVAGMPTSYGIAALKQQGAMVDAGIVQLLRQNGSIILGKTALSQLASWPYSEPPGFAPSRNPWNLDYTSGGSSGGAAAAVAAGLCSVAQGSDGGGSIRGPAFCCGVVGIKPSRGRVSAAPLGELMAGLATEGALGRCVADAAALLDAMTGRLPGDPYWLPQPSPSFLQTVQRIQQQQQLPPGLVMAVVTEFVGFPALAPACQEAVEQACQVLQAAGVELETLSLDLQPLRQPFTQVWSAMVAAAGVPRELLEPMNQWLLDQTPAAGVYIQAQQALQLLAREFSQTLAPYAAVLMPTYLAPPIPLEAWQRLEPGNVMEQIAAWIAPCPLANVLGRPAIALPTGVTSVEGGVPVGIQVMADQGCEAIALEIASYLELCLQFSGLPPGWGVDR